LFETLSQKYLTQKRAGGVAQGVGPEFKPQYRKKKKEKRKRNPSCMALQDFFDSSWWLAAFFFAPKGMSVLLFQ
jgi:hypothetical protein